MEGLNICTTTIQHASMFSHVHMKNHRVI